MAVRHNGDGQVDRWNSMMADTGELALRVDGTLLDLVVDVESGERKQFVAQFAAILSASNGIAGLEQERQGRRNAASLKRGRSHPLARRSDEGRSAAPKQSCPAAASRSRTRPAATTHLVRGRTVDQHVAPGNRRQTPARAKNLAVERDAGGGTRTPDTRIMIPSSVTTRTEKCLLIAHFGRRDKARKYPISGSFWGNSG
jgi:hypothetical protein